MRKGSGNKEIRPTPTPPAAGQFGIEQAVGEELRRYRPTGCPSVEQFEARFHLTSTRPERPRLV